MPLAGEGSVLVSFDSQDDLCRVVAEKAVIESASRRRLMNSLFEAVRLRLIMTIRLLEKT